MNNKQESSLGNKEIMAKNIRYYMDIHHTSRYDLAAAIDVAYTTLTDWINGRKYPRIDKIERMANYFGVAKSDLVEDHSSVEYTKKASNAIRIPVLGDIAAGVPLEAVEDIIDYEEIPAAMARDGDYFALRVKGDSMLPKISNGDVVIVKKQEAVENGDIAVVLVNGNSATVKKILVANGGLGLIPLNPAFEMMTYSPKDVQELPVKILGKVVELRAKF